MISAEMSDCVYFLFGQHSLFACKMLPDHEEATSEVLLYTVIHCL